MRIGVLYDDGSLNVMSSRDGAEIAEVRAREELKRWNARSKPSEAAKLVSIDLHDADIVEIE